MRRHRAELFVTAGIVCLAGGSLWLFEAMKGSALDLRQVYQCLMGVAVMLSGILCIVRGVTILNR